MSWVYKLQTKPLNPDDDTDWYEVGFYAPHGQFISIDRFKNNYEAANVVHYLNGGGVNRETAEHRLNYLYT